MSQLIHLAIGSTCSKPGEVLGNLAQIATFARQAARDGADLLLTPELSASGYGPYPEILATAEPAGDGPIYAELARLAASTGVVLLAGFVERAGDKRHLAHYVVYPDGRFVVQRKHRVTLAERPLDPAVALSGHPEGAPDPADPGQPLELKFTTFTVRAATCAITICADGGITNVRAHLASLGVRVVLGPAGAGGQLADRVTTADLKTQAGREKYAKWIELVCFPGRAAIVANLEHRQATAAVNQCGYDGRRHAHLGHGTIITAMGEIPAIIHGLPNLDRQRPLYTHAEVDLAETIG